MVLNKSLVCMYFNKVSSFYCIIALYSLIIAKSTDLSFNSIALCTYYKTLLDIINYRILKI